ncbi:hypothetical protein BDI4_380127 [Burkholderia diffusa]|nr:hypothetical protein BDI4_380127 [Burkholderia diffusa]
MPVPASLVSIRFSTAGQLNISFLDAIAAGYHPATVYTSRPARMASIEKTQHNIDKTVWRGDDGDGANDGQ